VNDNYDVIVIGGGAAGLAGALALARARRSVLVVDAGEPRNARAGHVHNYLGREGTPPLELVTIGRDEVRGYGGEIVEATVTALARDGDGFTVTLEDGRSARARRLLVTTGLADELPGIEGVAERFGRDVLHCPYCHGWEVRDQAIGVIGGNPMAVHVAQLWRQLSADVTLFRHEAPELTDTELEELEARGIRVVEGEVVAVEVTGDRLTGVRMAGGDVVPRQAVAVAPRFSARAELLTSLGLELSDQVVQGHVIGSFVPADPTGATAEPGVWVAGNVANPTAQVIVSAAGGLTAGAAINADLVAEETRTAVGARRQLVGGARGGHR